MTNYYLGLDSGGTFIKAGIYDVKGKEIAVEQKISQLIAKKPGWVERDPTSLFDDACYVIKKAIASANIDGNSIKAMSISAQGKGLYLIDKQGKPFRNAILSADGRAIDIVRKWQSEGIPEQIYPISRQTLWTGHPVSILRWLKDNERDSYDNIGSIFMMHDYLRYCFTGKKHCEITNISESNLFNANSSDYDDQLFEIFNLNEVQDSLPDLLASDEFSGYIKPDIAAQLGLSKDVAVFGGLFDVVGTALCSGIGIEDKINAVMGTWSISSVITDSFKKNSDYNYVYGHYAQKGEYIIHEASPTSASNFEWFVQKFNNKNLTYDEINKMVASTNISNILFTPFLYGSNVALGVKSGFYGIEAHHDAADIYRAIYEGIVFCHFVHIEKITNMFKDIGTLRVTGGATRSDIWMQIFADISGFPLEVPIINETGCKAAAMIAAKGYGEYQNIKSAFSDNDMEIRNFEVNKTNNEIYQNKYLCYKKLTSLFKDMV